MAAEEAEWAAVAAEMTAASSLSLSFYSAVAAEEILTADVAHRADVTATAVAI